MESTTVAKAMIEYGGDFVKLLGEALLHADSNNCHRIKNAFPDYWEKYSNYAGVRNGIPPFPKSE